MNVSLLMPYHLIAEKLPDFQLGLGVCADSIAIRELIADEWSACLTPEICFDTNTENSGGRISVGVYYNDTAVSLDSRIALRQFVG